MKEISQILNLIESLPAVVVDNWIVFAVIGSVILYLYKKKIKRISRKVVKLMYLAQGSIISLGILRDILRMIL